MDTRKIALEDFINDTVERVKLGIYKWHDIYYQVLPYKKIRKGYSQFNRLSGKIDYRYRELTKEMQKKLIWKHN